MRLSVILSSIALIAWTPRSHGTERAGASRHQALVDSERDRVVVWPWNRQCRAGVWEHLVSRPEWGVSG